MSHEYRVGMLPGHPADLEDSLNTAARDGWRLLHVQPVVVKTGPLEHQAEQRAMCVFEREKPEDKGKGA